ncbi:MAG TPA: GspE/PulE family protein [Tepidisphaeraceae bacterium]|jgi:type IV pilus assembly protein PilB|nr:GspE/PulE family protein [Tepidisphaeraceae bacterium]
MFGKKSTSSAPSVLEASEDFDESLPEFQTLWEPPIPRSRPTLEQLLLERGQISDEQLVRARQIAAQTPGKTLLQVLRGMNVAGEAQILSALAATLDLPFQQPAREEVDPAAFALLPHEFIRKHAVIPLRFESGRVVIAAADPNNVFLLDQIAGKLQRQLRVVVTPASDIFRLLEELTIGTVDGQVEQILKDAAADHTQAAEPVRTETSDLEKVGNDSPIIRFVNHLITEALRLGASDIHIEPKEKTLRVRYRVDGLLFESLNPPLAMLAPIVSRLKIMANLDISERRLPQDGRVRATIRGRTIDLRLSTLPTAHGEKCVLRILDNRAINVSVGDLGLSDNSLTIWKHQIAQPHGILLVTGPTGSGKTTTLYSSLRCMDANHLNISTVEDPIEYHLDSATQIQVHEKIGMTFSAALRALLRQDPDVVMIGEIRDQETAGIAVQAALTGHMVLSTLHTNDAPSSVTRLINMGVEPFHISAAVNAILAQRLVRKICTNCREEYTPSEDMAEFMTMQGFDAKAVYQGKGCDRCRKTGYSGRLGIYELLVMDDALRDMVTRNPDVNQLRRMCRERGLVTLREDGFQKVMQGITTVDEILRVTENGA